MARFTGTNDDDLLQGSRLATGHHIPGSRPLPGDPPWDGNADMLDGRAGNDSLYGGTGHDRLIGGAGRDSLDGGAGSDTILPAGGAFLTRPEGNIVHGGPGKDWASYEDEVFETVILSLGGGLSYDVLLDVENLRGGGGRDRLTGDAGRNRLDGMGGSDTLVGNGGNDSLSGGDESGLGDDLYGGLGNDSLDGGKGFDFLDGGSGSDWLRGGDAADLLQGGAGSDTLEGGLGADTMTGGSGGDVFLYASAAEGGDVILRYLGMQDSLQILATGFGGGLAAGLDILVSGHYVENRTGLATSGAGVGQFVFNKDTQVLLWDADGAGGAGAVMIAALPDVRDWSGAEIILV